MGNGIEPKKLNGTFKNNDIVSLDQFSQEDLKLLFSHVSEMKQIATNSTPSTILAGTITTLLFYEPSSRTFGSFSAAIKRLGGQTLEILNPEHFSSVSKGETLEDTIQVFESYSDAIVIRHKEAGGAISAANAASIPVVNAGDGIGEHPTQTLLDMYTIHERFGKLSNLTGLLAGDVKNSRTIHSLIRGLSLFEKNTLYLLSPQELKLSREEFTSLSKRGIKLIEITDTKDIPKNADFWYWTRVQKERFDDQEQYERLKHMFVVTPELMKEYAQESMILMDPLPRIKTIDTAIDNDQRAVYLKNQVRNGLYVRMALLALILGRI